MKPLRPTFLAVRIRDICNHWPQYSHMRDIPKYCDSIAMDEILKLNIEEARDKQSYLQSLHTPT